MHSTFSLDIAKNLVDSKDQFPVDFDLAWQWLNYNSKSDAKVSFVKCEMAKDIDFISFQDKSVKPLGGRPTEVIKMTVDAFKCWAMMSKTETGKVVRQYFLECEKIAKENALKPKTALELAREQVKLLEHIELQNQIIEAQEKRLIEAQPKIDYADAVACSDDCISMNEFAKLIGTGRTRLFRQLRAIGIIMQSSTLPYQRYCDSGFFEVGQVITQYGVEPYALVTGKGQLWLCGKLGLRAKPVSQLSLL